MKIGKIENVASLPISASAVKAVTEFLANNDLNTVACGKTELGDEHFVNICEADTVPHTVNRLEFHGKYADIQCIISGEEKFLLADLADSVITQPYSAEKDVGFVVANKVEAVEVSAGSFIYFAPGELHGPGLAAESGECRCKKAIFKIRMG